MGVFGLKEQEAELLLSLPGYGLFSRAYEGSATVVYRGRRDTDGAAVAVKVTRSEFPMAKELARLRREFALLEELGDLHGVVHAYALERCGRGLALVMEDLGACSLHGLLVGRRLDVGEALKMAIALADTLDSLHGRGILHKDIKPHNVMIDEATALPRLVDFGISARLSREVPCATSVALLEGTLAYMSPEQTGRMNRAIDLRTDLYSLGATFYEMLTGAPPFSATAPTELIHCHIARAPTPPHERAKEVPPALSDVVMRLLAKTPEERYQSARGLRADLDRCLSQWLERRQIEPFPLGREDITGELRIPQKLYGRERDLDALLFAFERVRKGASELTLISGYSGVGKSALVSELHKPIARRGGAFIRGKYDPITRDVPLAPLAHAFRELIRQTLTGATSTLEALRGALLEALGPNGRLLFDLIPELELVIGPQPEVPALGPTEARNRFELVMQRFVRVFATAEHPLALFLDDLQWADPASLRLLGLLLGDPDGNHLLILGAYRDNEVDAAHPLLITLAELRRTGAAISEIKLQPLTRPTVTALLAETLRKEERDVEELSALMLDKTQGNPFFLSQLLGAIHDERLLWFDGESGAFTWDLGRIRAARVTDNVVDFMLGKLQRLSPRTQRVLSLSACIGHAFDLAVLATIHQRSAADTAADLWEALREGLIVPLDGDYRLLDTSAGSAPEPFTVDWQVSYRFLHDRVQEAAYALIDADQKVALHLSIGQLLWARSGEPPRDEHLLEIVRHLRLSAHTLVDAAERRSVARLYLRAGRKAKAATAYKAADEHFTAGIALLQPGGWEHEGALCFDLHIEGAEGAYLSGAIERAESLFAVLLPRASTRIEQARIHRLRMILLLTLGKSAEALEAGRAGLAVFGVALPEEDEVQAVFGRELAEVTATLGDRRIEDLIHGPALDDPALRAVLELLTEIVMPLHYLAPDAIGVVALKIVNISLTHGLSDVSAYGLGMYGLVLVKVLGRPSDAHAFINLALAVHERFPNIALSGKLYASVAISPHPMGSIRSSIHYYQRGWMAALEAGDFLWLAINYHCTITYKFCSGVQLDELHEEVERAIVVVRRTQYDIAMTVLSIMKQGIAALQGRTRGRASLSSDDGFDEDRLVAKIEGGDYGGVLCVYHFLKMKLHHLHGEHEAVIAAAEQAERASVHVLGMYFALLPAFYACLSLLALPVAGTPEEEERSEASVARSRAQIAGNTASCPENFQHQLLLIDAERARRAGKHIEAMELYDQAITQARNNGFPHMEALANELCAKMYLSIGRSRAARGYMNDAHLGYLHWGASVKAEELARDHEPLLFSQGGRRRRSTSVSYASFSSVASASSSLSVIGTTVLGETIAGDLRDAALIVRAAQAIAGENMLEKVIERLSRIVLESAGAERGALLRERRGQLFVEATFGAGPDALYMEPGSALETRYDIAQSVALFVARTRERVVIDSTDEGGLFAADPYFGERGAISILCLPLLYQDRLSGLLYLENRKAASAFNKVRVELLELISSQAAIAIENAQLVADVRAANLEVQRVNERLEADVLQRTEQLSLANARLELELVEREQGEQERAALKERVIEVQRARLSETATPLIPITDRIMVMPLIGTVDAERAAQVLEVALEGAQRHQARVVILDVTGIKQIDGHVVRALLDCANALRLLGTQAVLTGIRAEVAQTMVAMEMDLGSILTKSTLQSGIAHALKVSGEVVGKRAPELARR